jgi:hypothetical protein
MDHLDRSAPNDQTAAVRLRLALLGCLVPLLAGAGSAAAAHPHAVAPLCRAGYYENVDGRCVERPDANAKGATARCRDGTYSHSRHASGTCSGHHGVAVWIHHP